MADDPETNTAADRRAAARKIASPWQYLVLGGIHAILAAVMIALALLKIHGSQVSVFGNVGIMIFSVAAAAFAASSIALLVAALSRSRHATDDSAPADRSFAGYTLPIFCLVVAIALLTAVVTVTVQNSEREHRTAAIQGKLDDLKGRIDRSRSGETTTQQRADLQTRLDAVEAEVKALRR